MRNFLDTEPMLWNRIIASNLYRPLHIHHAMGRRMVAGFGCVLNVVSDTGRAG
jgi:2-hydroxycyclohexanecarboxyl-CoA dehydrogenase